MCWFINSLKPSLFKKILSITIKLLSKLFSDLSIGVYLKSGPCINSKHTTNVTAHSSACMNNNNSCNSLIVIGFLGKLEHALSQDGAKLFMKVYLKFNNSNSTLRLWSSQISSGLVTFWKKEIEKDLVTAGIQTWVQLIRSRLC